MGVSASRRSYRELASHKILTARNINIINHLILNLQPIIINQYLPRGPQDFLHRRCSFSAGIEPAHFPVRAIRRLLPDCSTIFTFF